MSLRRSLGDLVDTLSPIAERLGCSEDLQRVNEILERGTSATRQREVFDETRDLSRVVDLLVEEMKTGKPRPLPDHSLPGGGVVHGTAMKGEKHT
jgi:carboxylate-amine ligase